MGERSGMNSEGSPGLTIRKVSIGVQRGERGAIRVGAQYAPSPNTLRHASTTWTNKRPSSPRLTSTSSVSTSSSCLTSIPLIVTSDDDTNSLQTSSTSTQLSSSSTKDSLRQSLERLKALNDKRAKPTPGHGKMPRLLAIEQLQEDSPEAARSMRKRGTTALAVLKKKNEQDPFYDFTKPIRRTQSEPFLASWDYTARHAYVASEVDKSAGALSSTLAHLLRCPCALTPRFVPQPR